MKNYDNDDNMIMMMTMMMMTTAMMTVMMMTMMTIDNDDNDNDDFRVGMVWPMEDFREVEVEVVWTGLSSQQGNVVPVTMM